MQVHVTFRHLESTESLNNYVQEKLLKLNKYFIKPVDAHVILSVEKFRQQCEIVLTARDFRTTAHEVSDDMYHSIDLSINRLTTQVRKHKEIIKEHKGHVPVHETASQAEAAFLRQEDS
jgi:putative sigma-54 modulation protein